MIKSFGWCSLEHRIADVRLCKIVYNIVALPLSDYIQPNPLTSRRDHSKCTRQRITTSAVTPFPPLAMVQWNSLPEGLLS